ncbi:MAG: HAMP domain-containing sensor histidine kinase [Candidatus Poribacteria bacterium]
MLRSILKNEISWNFRTGDFFRNYFILGILGLAIVFLLYSNWVTRRLEREISSFSMMLGSFVAKLSTVADKETSEAGQLIIKQLNFPYIVADADGKPIVARNIGTGLREKIIAGTLTETERDNVKKMIARMDKVHTSIVMKGLEQDRTIIGYMYYDQTKWSINQGSSFILSDVSGDAIFWKNIGSEKKNPISGEATRDELRIFIEQAKKRGLSTTIQYNPSAEKTYFLHYGNTGIIHEIRWWMPLAQIGIVIIFLTVGFIAYQRIKHNEQQAIWAGLAKETAHQLGTPISSLMGWLDILEDEDRKSEILKAKEGDEEPKSIYKDMQNDLQRLRDITSRFGEIGSIPKRELLDVSEIAHRAVLYFQKRLPHRQKHVDIIESYQNVPKVRVNENLLQWVIENLIRNSLDAIDKENGLIEIKTEYDPKKNYVLIVYKDNGKGIPRKNRNKIFLPGYSTKKLGWGLGLAIVKRIIEGYHDGHVRLAESGADGSTFVIELPANV